MALTPYCAYRWRQVCCWFSPLLREVFLQVLRFSSLLKNQHFQIPIWSEMNGHISRSSLGTPTVVSSPWVHKLQILPLLQFQLQPWNVQLYYRHPNYYTSTTSVCFGVSCLMARMETDCNVAIIQYLSFRFSSMRKDGWDQKHVKLTMTYMY